MNIKDLKLGDIVVIKEANNGQPKTNIGKRATVMGVYKGFVSLSVDSQGTWNYYQTYCGYKDDVIEFLTRKERAEILLDEINKLKNILKNNEQEYELLVKYSSDEEEVAAKLAAILKNPTKKAIQKVLETLKKTDYL